MISDNWSDLLQGKPKNICITYTPECQEQAYNKQTNKLTPYLKEALEQMEVERNARFSILFPSFDEAMGKQEMNAKKATTKKGKVRENAKTFKSMFDTSSDDDE